MDKPLDLRAIEQALDKVASFKDVELDSIQKIADVLREVRPIIASVRPLINTLRAHRATLRAAPILAGYSWLTARKNVLAQVIDNE